MAEMKLLSDRLGGKSLDQVLQAKAIFSEAKNVRDLSRSIVTDSLTSWAINPANPSVLNGVQTALASINSSRTLIDRVMKVVDLDTIVKTGFLGNIALPDTSINLGDNAFKQQGSFSYDNRDDVKDAITFFSYGGSKIRSEVDTYYSKFLYPIFTFRISDPTYMGLSPDYKSYFIYVMFQADYMFDYVIPSQIDITPIDDDDHFAQTPYLLGVYASQTGNQIRRKYTGPTSGTSGWIDASTVKAAYYSPPSTQKTADIKVGTLISLFSAWQSFLAYFPWVDRELIRVVSILDLCIDVYKAFGYVSSDVSDSALAQSVKDYLYRTNKYTACCSANKHNIEQILNITLW